MNRFLLTFPLLLLFVMSGCSDSTSNSTPEEAKDPLVQTYDIERFKLFPTQNMWTFILLDTVNGSTWQVQWSQNADERVILPISN